VRISWALFYAFIWIYRSAVSVVAQLVISRLTLLGDARYYQDATLSGLEFEPGEFTAFSTTRYFATVFTRGIGAFFNLIFDGNPILINIGFQTIGFVGIVYFLQRLPVGLRLAAAFVLLLPSFTMWSSIAGKEALVVGAVGILAGATIDMLLHGKRFNWLHGFALFLVATTREHYLPSIIFLMLGIAIASRVKQRGFLLLLGGTVSVLILFVLQDAFADLAYSIIPDFDTSGSTREPFWDVPAEVLPKALEGMWLSFYGPTLQEATSGGILQMMSFAESAILLATLAVVALRHLLNAPATMIILAGFSIFWLLLANYPMGVMNPGSAVRYRTGYEIFIVACIFVVLSRSSHAAWMKWSMLDRIAYGRTMKNSPTRISPTPKQ